jgi:hypothetical protein
MNRLDGTELHVFEPNPAAAAVCRENLRRLIHAGRHAENAVIFNQPAVTDAVGTRKFYAVDPTRSKNKDIGFSSLYRINPAYTQRLGSIVQVEHTPDILWCTAI